MVYERRDLERILLPILQFCRRCNIEKVLIKNIEVDPVILPSKGPQIEVIFSFLTGKNGEKTI